MNCRDYASRGIRALLGLSLAVATADSLASSAGPAEDANPTAFGLRLDLEGDGAMAPLLNAAHILRADWIAQDVGWRDIEPSPGQYHWEGLDGVVAAAGRQGFRILLSVAGAPAWARPAGSDLSLDGPPADYITFANFVYQLARRYERRVAAYEVWPEANLRARWSEPAGLSPERYAELLRQASTAIRVADPTAIVVGGSLAPTGVNDGLNAIDDLAYLQRLYQAGAAAHFGALGVRVDGYNNPPGDSPDFSSVDNAAYKGHTSFYFRHYERVRQVMVANGDAGKALWITSAGWASSSAPRPGMEFAADVTEEQQAAYLVTALAQVQARPYVALLIVNNLNLSTVPGSDPSEAAYSLIRSDWSARPALLTMANARRPAVAAAPAATRRIAPAHVLQNWSPRQRQPTTP